MKKLLQLPVLLLLALSASVASAATIDFEGFAPGSFSNGVEDGYTINSTLGNGEIYDYLVAGNVLGHDAPGNATITITNGGLFTFDSIDVGFFNFIALPLPPSPVVITGLNGLTTIGVEVFNPANGSLSTHLATALAGLAIDTLIIELGAAVVGPTVIDNIVLGDVSAVPVPAAVWFLGSALMGLLAYRKKMTA